MAKISLLVCSRVSGNRNFALLNLLDSLKRMTSNYDNVEVLVKFDTDDRRVHKVLPKLGSYPFKVKYLIEPRGRGYVDLHVFYTRLFSLVDEKSIVMGAMGDDFVITLKHWDEIVLSKVNLFPDQIFIIHGRQYPADVSWDHASYLDFDIDSLEERGVIDEAPLWSRKLLDICGGLGHVSFTDAWTLALEYYLFHRCGLNRTIFLDERIITRSSRQDVDGMVAVRYWSQRADNFAFMRTHFYKTLVEQQALNVYLNIKMPELSLSPPPLIEKTSDFRPKDVSSMLTKIRILNRFPPFMRPAVIKAWLFLKPYLKKVNPGIVDQ